MVGGAVATGVQTSMDLGAGFVDVLRFGEGAAEGGLAASARTRCGCLPSWGRWARPAACSRGWFISNAFGSRCRFKA